MALSKARGYALPLTAGLLGGVSLIKIGLSASLPNAAFQLEGTAQSVMGLSYVAAFVLLVPCVRRDRTIFFKTPLIVLLGLLLAIGPALLFFPVGSGGSASVLTVVGLASHAAGNAFFLCALIVMYSESDRENRIKSLLLASAISCLVFSFGTLLPTMALQFFFLAVIAAFLLSFSMTSILVKRDGERKPVDCTRPLPFALYVVYGFSMGTIPGLDLSEAPRSPLSEFYVVAIVLVTLAVAQLFLPKGAKALRMIQAAIVVFGILALLPLGISMTSSIQVMLIFSWLLFWVYLFLGIPPVRGKKGVDPLAAIVGSFAIGWIVSRAAHFRLAETYPELSIGLSLAGAVMTIAIPAYSLVLSFKRSRREPPGAPVDGGDRLARSCSALAGEFQLTKREEEVLSLLAAGRGRQYVSEALVISEGTAKTHIKHIYAKLGIHSKEELLDLVHSR
ncbi:hypothetical protein GS424_007060 [Eggerthella guodeyinii]|uniref:Uncharacterized protein n=1 Tax=Eggerthella guodeyinii TaxID=2690837 RepID=A0A6L7IQH7_9ACTN|nr:helix-turn-helix transcriptional regulator [Eggerthella guodeyinii]QOS69589.1 hypothetical protein GS424_007060 [Eggerthella guodeyinii]